MLAITALACLVIGLVTGYGIASRIHQEPLSQKPKKKIHKEPNSEPLVPPPLAPQAPSGAGSQSLDDPVIDEIKIFLLGLLNTLNTANENLLDGSDKYASSLNSQREELKETLTIGDLQQLGAKMVHKVEAMHTSNKQHRANLDSANTLLTEQRAQLEDLQLRTGKDFLTSVANRSAYDDRIREISNIARRYGNIFSLMIMDIDNFKKVNDEYGHTAGDTVLKDIAKLLSECSRASDFLARYGGEEFVYILPETSADQALKLGDKLRKLIEDKEFIYDDTPIPITISGGIGAIKPGQETSDDLFARADAALYKAKENGRNRIESEVG